LKRLGGRVRNNSTDTIEKKASSTSIDEFERKYLSPERKKGCEFSKHRPASII
jgi:hypothetical protein